MYNTDMIMDLKKDWQGAITMELFEEPAYVVGIMSEPDIFPAMDLYMRRLQEKYQEQYRLRLAQLNTTVHTYTSTGGKSNSWIWWVILGAAGFVAYKICMKIFESTPQGAALKTMSKASESAQKLLEARMHQADAAEAAGADKHTVAQMRQRAKQDAQKEARKGNLPAQLKKAAEENASLRKAYQELERRINATGQRVSAGSHSGLVRFVAQNGKTMGLLRAGNGGYELYQRV